MPRSSLGVCNVYDIQLSIYKKAKAKHIISLLIIWIAVWWLKAKVDLWMCMLVNKGGYSTLKTLEGYCFRDNYVFIG